MVNQLLQRYYSIIRWKRGDMLIFLLKKFTLSKRKKGIKQAKSLARSACFYLVIIPWFTGSFAGH